MNRIIILILGAILLQACAAVDDSKKSISLDKSLYFYESAMRWADFPAANSLRRYEGEGAPANDPAKLKRIKVTGYDVLSTKPSADDSAVYITVKISYYDEDSLKLMSLTDNQVWRYDATEKIWYISTALPVFK
ncbi:MAG TPA: hypothetical protein VET88_08720 [Gammaproteobacteria bacterium]|nr:hypothetical protein [Gammaproteobacteria bacterium]